MRRWSMKTLDDFLRVAPFWNLSTEVLTWYQIEWNVIHIQLRNNKYYQIVEDFKLGQLKQT